ncbi:MULTISPECIES: MetQ/NlpA family ABC transporter substrate-binding protein [Enterococcus]|uniref:Lipoprotein n=1 Tax=Enterococcus alishanensis TaxID=1303817 RepID=A0ABS6TBY7_9ENTE|nr:MetQ/NlpA family ABC transporter substrate-binding protein [Enterococcus alishanensis]MBV7390405.1 MetQ/NlpA family ABC transporter substrate-binding protein [Enterococcus alishanensis]
MKAGVFKKATIFGGIALAAAVLLSGCGASKSGSDEALSTKEISVGVTAGPHEQIMENVAKLAKEDGLTIKLTTFDDYNTPNTALNDGDLNSNSYQTIQFLDQQVEDRGYDIVPAFKTIYALMGIYSNNVDSVEDIPDGAKIGVPNDPSNEYRALKLLETAGLIKLKSGLNESATKNDIAENPKNLDIQELEASQIVNQLDDLSAAVVNGNFAVNAGLSVEDDAIFGEPTEGNEYYNVFAVQKGHKDDEVVKTIKKYYQSAENVKYIEDTFKGAIVPAFE